MSMCVSPASSAVRRIAASVTFPPPTLTMGTGIPVRPSVRRMSFRFVACACLSGVRAPSAAGVNAVAAIPSMPALRKSRRVLVRPFVRMCFSIRSVSTRAESYS